MLDNIPQTINAVETRYCWASADKFAPPAPPRRIGGETTPANIARALFNDMSDISKKLNRDMRVYVTQLPRVQVSYIGRKKVGNATVETLAAAQAIPASGHLVRKKALIAAASS